MVAFLCDGRSYGLPGAEVERITTHAAHVFLVGERAYKMKRAVRYSFLDFTTLDRRRRALEAELELNRRTAPMLYRRLVPVTRADGDRLALAGSGEPVEWLLEMARFDQEVLLDRVAARGQLTPAIVDDLAEEIAAFHAQAAVRTEYGGHAGMREVIEGNAEDFAALPEAIFGAERSARLTARCRDELAQAAGPARAAPALRPGAPLPRRSASWPTSSCSRAGRCCSTAWNSTRRWPRSTPCTISPSCSWTCCTRSAGRSLSVF